MQRTGPATSHLPTRDPALPAAVALALALALLPLALLLPIDGDRTPAILFLPSLWLAWRIPAPALTRRESLLPVWAAAAFVVSSVFSKHSAAASVAAAAAGLALGGAAVARRLAGSPTAVRLVLAGLLAGSLIGFLGVLAGWGENRMTFPVYWSARIFGAHAFAGALAGLVLLFSPDLRRVARLPVAAATLATWTALAWSGARGPALGMAVTLAVWFLCGGARVRRHLLIAAPLLALLALSLSRPLGIPYSQLGWWPALERTAAARSVRAITSDRTNYWDATWDQILRSPWIGNGADAYRFITPKQQGNQPHNTYLQWLLEHGVFGALPLLALLLGALRPLIRRPSAKTGPADPIIVWAASASAGIATYAFFDGAAYHLILFMPFAVIVGLAWMRPDLAGGACARGAMPARALASTAAALLVIHAWLGWALLRDRDVMPGSPAARVLRVFPSTTHGVDNWIHRWMRIDPVVGFEWIVWAQHASNFPARYHLQAAQLHLNVKNWAAAERELVAALATVPREEREDVRRLLDEIRAILAKSPPAASASTQPSPVQT